MPNPKGTPKNLKPLKTDRDEPLAKQLSLRITDSMMIKLKVIDDYREFVRQAIQKALDELDTQE